MSNCLKFFFIISFIFLSIPHATFADGFYSIYSKDGSEVWAVGNTGNLFKSVDGGQNWSSYTLGGATYYSIFALGTNVWIAGTDGTLQRSGNGGLSWTPGSISAQTLKSIFFVDANTGWIVGNAGTILKTTNSGTSWTPQTSPVSNNLNSVKFTSSTNGVACGDGGKAIWTSNGGSTWSQYTTPTTYNLLSIDRKVFTIIAGAEYGIVIKSTTSGTTWSTLNYKIDTKSDITGIHMVDPNIYYSCGGGGFIRRSNDAGNTFIHQMNPMMGNLVAIYFYDVNTGWAVSSLNNAILRTVDGGNTWSFPAGTTVSFSWTLKRSGTGNIGNGFSLHGQNRNSIYIAMGSQIYRSYDRGETWSQFATLPTSPAHSFYVSPLDSNLMVASTGSGSGRVQRSTNYGASWTETFAGALTSYGMPLEMDQNNPNVVYLAPDNSLFKKSTNFGATFVNIGGPPISYNGGLFRSPCDIVVSYENSDILYLGDGTTGFGSGELFKSTNGGVNWFSIHSVGGSEIPMISISSLDLNLSYHTSWSSGGFWKSTNQWATFSQVASTGNQWATDIAKDDPNTVAYGLYAQPVYISTNAGASFVLTTTPSSPEAGMLFYDKGTLFSQKGGGVYKCNITYTVPTVLGSHQISSEIPREYALSQNYPNPFNPITKIEYDVAFQGIVKIVIYDVLGKPVQEIVNQELQAGKYEAYWNASGQASGIYFYTMYAGGAKIDSRKMILVK